MRLEIQDEQPAPQNLSDLEALAKVRLPRAVYDYYAGGAEDEQTLLANRRAFERFSLRRRVLVDVGAVDTSVELLGQRLPHPILLAPTAFQRLAHPDGEVATVRAAAATESVYVASTLATTSLEEIAAAAAGPLWFQLYVYRDREITRELVQRAEAAGYGAICLTVTVPVQGKRERDSRNQFSLGQGIEMANFRGRRQAGMPESRGSGLESLIAREFDPSLSWEAVDWLRSLTRLPVVLKGVADPEDASRAVEEGASAIVVSNHGGRQLDCEEPTLLALPRVAEAVAGRAPVLVDGGVRRGTDVVKALALGARAVLVGRPYLWGLAVEGQAGVESVVKMLRAELERSLMLLGRARLDAIDRSVLAE